MGHVTRSEGCLSTHTYLQRSSKMVMVPDSRSSVRFQMPTLRPIYRSSSFFTRIVREIGAYLRRQGIQIFLYLDDWLILAPSLQQIMKRTRSMS
jgi:hypothetical protein